MKRFAILWFKSGRTSMALAARWRRQGYTAEAALLGARDAYNYYKNHITDRDRYEFFERRRQIILGNAPEEPLSPRSDENASVSEGVASQQAAFFEKRRHALKGEAWRARVAAARKIDPRAQAIERGPRDGAPFKLPEYESRHDVMPQLGEGLRRRVA